MKKEVRKDGGKERDRILDTFEVVSEGSNQHTCIYAFPPPPFNDGMVCMVHQARALHSELRGERGTSSHGDLRVPGQSGLFPVRPGCNFPVRTRIRPHSPRIRRFS